VIPAAGFGTRMLPATKSIPKELLPVDGKPVIQHIVEELVEAGIEDILIILRKGKEIIKEHFQKDQALIDRISAKYPDIAQQIIELSEMANLSYVYQDEMRGLGDAVMYAAEFVGDEAFCLATGDTLIRTDDQISVSRRLATHYRELGKSIVAVEEVEPRFKSRYGILVDSHHVDGDLYQAKKWVEKPAITDTDSNLAIASRYILTSEIFEILRSTKPGYNGELQITDAMDKLTSQDTMYAYCFSGVRYDIGSKEGFAKAIKDYDSQ